MRGGARAIDEAVQESHAAGHCLQGKDFTEIKASGLAPKTADMPGFPPEHDLFRQQWPRRCTLRIEGRNLGKLQAVFVGSKT